jgi:hypothetical protein
MTFLFSFSPDKILILIFFFPPFDICYYYWSVNHSRPCSSDFFSVFFFVYLCITLLSRTNTYMCHILWNMSILYERKWNVLLDFIEYMLECFYKYKKKSRTWTCLAVGRPSLMCVQSVRWFINSFLSYNHEGNYTTY